MNHREFRILVLAELEINHAIIAGLDSVFFEASSVRAFASPEARATFRQRWLGDYLTLDNKHCFLALDQHDNVAGYVVGCLSDPSPQPRFAEIGYFKHFATQTRRYPAHLHINIASQHRSAGLGSRLLEAFCTHAAIAAAPGVHVVTGAGMRNVGFYLRNGFAEVARAPWREGEVVMLARALAGRRAPL